MSDCWYIPQELPDQRDENRYEPNKPATYELLSSLNFFYRRFDPNEIDDNVNAYAKTLLNEMHYKHFDVIEISPELFGNKYYDLAVKHFEEHIHEDDEVRMIVAGQGYFDVRDENDEWIRVLTKAGDCIVVPAGAYHRFTCDHTHYIRAIRLFQTNPKWLSIPRHTGDGDKTMARKEYLRKLHEPRATVVGPAKGQVNHIYNINFPELFDANLNHIVKLFLREKLQKSNNITLTLSSLAIVISITGDIVPMTNESWCPDCVAVKDTIQESYNILCSILGTQNVLFVECPVVRASYCNNPNYAYRTHPILHVKGIPTVLILTPSSEIETIISHNSHVEWYEMFEVKVYTDNPTVEQLTEWESVIE